MNDEQFEELKDSLTFLKVQAIMAWPLLVTIFLILFFK